MLLVYVFCYVVAISNVWFWVESENVFVEQKIPSFTSFCLHRWTGNVYASKTKRKTPTHSCPMLFMQLMIFSPQKLMFNNKPVHICLITTHHTSTIMEMVEK